MLPNPPTSGSVSGMRRHPDEPATALRAALSSRWPRLQAAARSVIRDALKATTIGESAELLGVSRDTLERLRRDFPSVFAARKKST